MGTGSPRPVKPLAKPKFLANSIISAGKVMAELGMSVPEVCLRSRKSLEQESHDFFARKLWELGDALYRKSLNPTPWGDKWWQLKDALFKEPEVSAMVYISDASWGARYSRGVGQLMFIDRLREMPGQPRLYEEDGGPARFSRRFGIKLLSGEIETWTNCSVRRLPDHYLVSMLEDVYERVQRDNRWLAQRWNYKDNLVEQEIDDFG